MRRAGAALFLSLSTACYPTMPPVFAESTETLAPGKVGVTIGGGAGPYAPVCSTCKTVEGLGAGFARVRVGVAKNQEVGVSAFGVFIFDSTGVGAGGGGALGYKLRAARWMAFVTNAGVLDGTFTGDVALVFALYRDGRGRQVYSGLRGTVDVPIGFGGANSTVALTAPLGVELRPTPTTRLFLEAGILGGFSNSSFSNTILGFSGARTVGGSAWFGRAASAIYAHGR